MKTYTKKQRKEILRKWLVRLRNPKSRKYRGSLHSEDGSEHCCLGHLQCVVTKKKLTNRMDCSDNAYLQNDPLEEIFYPISGRDLANMNDGKLSLGFLPKSLSEIADFIEENVVL